MALFGPYREKCCPQSTFLFETLGKVFLTTDLPVLTTIFVHVNCFGLAHGITSVTIKKA